MGNSVGQRNIFRFIRSGSMAGILTPEDISLLQLQKLVETHKEFAPLVFQDDPSRLYTLANIAPVDANITKNALNVHMILHIPRIQTDNTWPLLEVHQVGLGPFEGKCHLIDTTNLVTMKNGQIHELSTNHCTIVNNHLSSCMMDESSKLQQSCLHDLSKCTFKPATCKDKTSYDEAGILVAGTAKDVFVMTKTGIITKYTQHKSPKPKFFTWNDYIQIQIDGITFEAPSYYPINYNVNQQIPTFSFTGFNPNMSIKDQIETGTTEQLSPETRGLLEKTSFALALISVTLCIILLTCCCKDHDIPTRIRAWFPANVARLEGSRGQESEEEESENQQEGNEVLGPQPNYRC